MSGADNARSLIDAVERSIASYYEWDWAQAEVIELANIEKSELALYEGDYLYKENGFSVSIRVYDHNQLLVDLPNGKSQIMKALDENHFIILEDNTRIEFLKNEDGQVIGLEQDGRYQLERIK